MPDPIPQIPPPRSDPSSPPPVRRAEAPVFQDVLNRIKRPQKQRHQEPHEAPSATSKGVKKTAAEEDLRIDASVTARSAGHRKKRSPNEPEESADLRIKRENPIETPGLVAASSASTPEAPAAHQPIPPENSSDAPPPEALAAALPEAALEPTLPVCPTANTAQTQAVPCIDDAEAADTLADSETQGIPANPRPQLSLDQPHEPAAPAISAATSVAAVNRIEPRGPIGLDETPAEPSTIQDAVLLPDDAATAGDSGADADGHATGDGRSPRAGSAVPASPAPIPAGADPAVMPDPASAVAQVIDQPLSLKSSLPLPLADPLEARFADANHPRIITAIQSELLPSGGTVRLRLDPPELGALQVRIDVRDGALAASFQTSSDEATHLLARSFQQLKHALESHGVTVEKLHVQQAPREQWDGGQGGEDRQQQSPRHWQQQEQQRREMLDRMWRRLRDLRSGHDAFDLVA